MLTIDGPSSVTNVGTAPWATAKFESLEKKKLVSPRDTEKTDAAKKTFDTEKADASKKPVEAAGPVLETQKSFNKSRADDTTPPKNPE